MNIGTVGDYVLVPRHSSEKRKYVPIEFFDKENIVADSCMAVGGATFYHKSFKDEPERLEFLFERYKELSGN